MAESNDNRGTGAEEAVVVVVEEVKAEACRKGEGLEMWGWSRDAGEVFAV